MIDTTIYLPNLLECLHRQFGARLVYAGLQGSYLRNEATETSDIDIMVVIEKLSAFDLDTYRSIIESLGDFEKSCGFICSKKDLANWNPLEICHLLHSTKDLYGSLAELVPEYTNDDIRNFIKMSVNNLYHEICHRYIHSDMDKNIDRISGTYKGVFFILQNLYYLSHGVFPLTKAELLPLLEGKDLAVFQRSQELNRGIQHDFFNSFDLLFTWCQETISRLN